MAQAKVAQEKILKAKIIKGKIVDHCGNSLAGLRVEAWDTVLSFKDAIASTTSNEKGMFRITLPPAQYGKSLPDCDEPQEIFFKVFEGDKLVHSTEDSVLWNTKKAHKTIIIEIPNGKLGAGNGEQIYLVNGRIVSADGTPQTQKTVTAFDQGLVETNLGTTTTDNLGRYEITYQKEDLNDAASGSANLIIKVLDPGNIYSDPLAVSPLFLNARPQETINLFVGDEPFRGPSDFEDLTNKLTPDLQSYDLDSLSEKAIITLASKVDAPIEIVQRFITSRQLQTQTKFSVPESVFFGLLSQGLPETLQGLLSQPKIVQANALEVAMRANIIPPVIAENLDEILDNLQAEMVNTALADGQVPENRPALVNTLDAAGLSEKQKRSFLKLYSGNDKSLPEFWDAVRKHRNFTRDTVKNLQFTIQLGFVTFNHFPMIGALKSRDDITTIVDLARLEKRDWLALIRDKAIGIPENVIGDGKAEQRQNYVTAILEIVEDAFPTAMLVHQLLKSVAFKGSDFETFFRNDRNQKFEFRDIKVATYFGENPGALAGIEQPEEFKKEMQAAQRVFRLLPQYNKFQAFEVLWQDKLHSAHQIRRMGPRFIHNYADKLGSVENARRLKRNADRQSSLALMTLAKFSATFNNISLPVLNSGAITPDADFNTIVKNIATPSLKSVTTTSDAELGTTENNISPPVLNGRGNGAEEGALLTEEEQQNVATLKALFGSLDFCDCQHCRSVLSPAAYLVDLLEFLRQIEMDQSPELAASGDMKITALEKLFERRPDIGNIELSCENTHTPQPAIDLICEILEYAVSGNNGNNFTNTTHEISGEKITVPVGAVPQTTGEAGELKAAPEHLNAAAYDNLKEARYPWRLPFDLSWEEANVYLNHLGMPRHKLMKYFAKDSDVAVEELTLAVEYLGITVAERGIITGSDGRGLDEQYGLNATITRDRLQEVPILLDRAALTYEELQKLLQSKFINPEGKEIISLNAEGEEIVSCKLADARLALSDAELERLHRFSRLLQKLNWSVVYLDKTLTTLGADVIDDALLVQLAHIKRLKKRFKLPVPELLSWWGLIDTAEYDDEENSLYEQLFLNPTVHPPSGTTAAPDLDLEAVFRLKADRTELENSDPANTLQHEEIKPLLLATLNISDENLNRLIDQELAGDTTLNLANLSRLYRISSFTAALKIDTQQFLALRALTGVNPLFPVSATDTYAFLEEYDVLRETGFDIETLDYLLRHQADPNSSLTLSEDEIQVTLEELRTELQKPREDIDPGVTDPKELLENGVIQHLATALSVDVEIIENVLRKHLSSLADPAQPAIDTFLDEAFVKSLPEQPVTRDDFAFIYQTYEWLYKIALLISKLHVEAEEMDFLFERGPGLGWLNMAKLPLSPVDTPPTGVTFNAWKRLAETYQLQKRIFTGDSSLFDLLDRDFAKTTRTDLETELSKLTQWNPADITFLTGAGGFDLSFPNDYQNELWLLKLRDAFAIVKRIGASAEQISDWQSPEISFDQARAIKNAAKAKHDNPTWLRIAAPLQDELREKRRDALQAYLVANHVGFEDVTSLYQHYLIDTDLNSCMMSSRIKQAILSIQLFVQRIMMNLETGITMHREEADQFKLIDKHYRIWEANRKIFLYPENWIEPELRDDKSPFFKDLEDELLQDDVNDETVERAYLNYLKKLDEVSRLEIAGMYHQTNEDSDGDDATDILHVFARTYGLPHIYYYRKWVDKAYWTAWERVDVDIQGEHLVPVVYNHRLYIFWLEFLGATDKDKTKALYEVRLAWSEYKNGKWNPKKLTGSENSPRVSQTQSKSGYYLWAFFDKNKNLYLDLRRPNKELCNNYTQFKMDSCTMEPHVVRLRANGLLKVPQANYENMKFHGSAGGSLELVFVGGIHKTTVAHGFEIEQLISGTKFTNILLKDVPSDFRITLPHQHPISIVNPFFYEDRQRTFLVHPTAHYFIEPFVMELPPQKSFVQLNANLTYPEDGAFAEKQRSLMPMALASGTEDSLSTPIVAFVNEHDGEQFFSGNGIGVIDHRAPSETAGSSGLNDFVSGLNDLKNASNEPCSEHYPTVINSASPAFFLNPQFRGYHFEIFYHPYVCRFIKQLNRYGIQGLLNPTNGDTKLLRQGASNANFFVQTYSPPTFLSGDVEEIDFDYGTPYGLYNWELFFHIPLMIAERLMQNQKFEEAQKWFHYVFDPTETDETIPVPQRFWKIKPFFEHDEASAIQDILRLVNEGDVAFKKQVEQWEKHPFQPHAVARLRLVAYMKTTVMNYIDNLIAWADNLFRRDTLESINEATQLYVLAAEILGRRPVMVERKSVTTETYNSLLPKLDTFSNALVLTDIENQLPEPAPDGALNGADAGTNALNSIFYFCIPKNKYLLDYWSTVEDRLFKIRNCMNIEGVTRQLPLFEPPIDPALLVRAFAAGVDLNSVLSDLNAPLPHYRFQHMLQQAMALCNDVKSLGAALLSALEKKDAETLSLMRTGHEIQLQKAVKQIKQHSIDEAKEMLASANKSKELAGVREQYYSHLLESGNNNNEESQLERLTDVNTFQNLAAGTDLLAAILFLFPELSFPKPSFKNGGLHFGAAANAGSTILRGIASHQSIRAQKQGIMGGYNRRSEEWQFQTDTISKELEQVEKQIIASEIRQAIAEKDLLNHELQIENSQEAETFLKDKFSNRDLYNWMVTQLSGIYFQTYQMAYDLARRAEQCFRHELAEDASNFIQFGYWDSLKKGLLCGERLYKDLHRMEIAYLDKNKREFEMSKQVSLKMLDPQALLQLHENGTCFFDVPETVFDLDYPGHFMRRIKGVSLTIPCVTGPYTNVNCTLTLVKSSVRMDSKVSDAEDYARSAEDERFKDYRGVQSIATSSAQNDAGVFEFNFRDERYVPFEGSGVISTWQLELPAEFRQFDYTTISDVILQMSYTAREGGEILKEAANKALGDLFLGEDGSGLVQMFSARNDFSSEWHRFFNPAGEASKQVLELPLVQDRFPLLVANKEIELKQAVLFLKLKEHIDYNDSLKFTFSPDGGPQGEEQTFTLVGTEIDGLAVAAPFTNGSQDPGMWSLEVAESNVGKLPAAMKKNVTIEGTDHARLNPEAFEDIFIVLNYTASERAA